MAPQTGNQSGKLNKYNVNDYISLLTDDILLIILSELKLTESARTSILSTRWRNLWTLLHSSLNIDGAEVSPGQQTMTRKFVNTVCQILGQQHKAQKIDQLAITYPCYVLEDLPCDRNSLIDIAIRKQVKTLQLDFSNRIYHRKMKPSPVPACFGSTTFFSLVTLHLESASLSPQVMDCILSTSCPNLEVLWLENGFGYVESLRIGTGCSSLKLKHLKSINNKINYLEISAPNLLSFHHQGGRRGTRIYFEDVPLLTDLFYCDNQYDYSVLLPQLEWLTVVYPSEPAASTDQLIPETDSLSLKNLKEMDFTFVSADGDDMDAEVHWFFRILEASPCLCRLTLTLRNDYISVSSAVKQYSTQNECVEVIEMYDFRGWDNEVELAACIARYSLSLKKIIIRTFFDTIRELESVKTVVGKLQSGLAHQDLQFQVYATQL